MSSLYQRLTARNRRSRAAIGTWETIVLSDYQPVDAAQIAIGRTILSNIKARHPGMDEMIVAGDLVHRGVYDTPPAPADRYEYEEFMADFGRVIEPRRMFCCAGNHDRNYLDHVSGPINSFDNYLAHLPRNTYYSLRGNVLTIFMGTVNPATAGGLHPTTVLWAMDLLRRFPKSEYVRIFVTHHAAPSCGLTNAETREYNLGPNGTALWNFVNSTGNEIDLWISGHIGGNLLNPAFVSHVYDGRAWHVNVGLHIPSNAASPENISYCRMRFTAGSPIISFERLRADTGAVDPAKSFIVRARVPVRLSSELIHDGRYDYDERTGLMESRQKIVSPVKSVYSSPGGVPTWTMSGGISDEFIGLYCFDPGFDVIAGLGPSINFYVPGGLSGEGGQDLPWGFGTALHAAKSSALDENYSARLNMYSSGAGQLQDSALLVASLLSTGNFYTTGRIGANTETPTGLFSGEGQNGGLPTFYSENSSQDIGVPEGQALRYGTVDGATFTTIGALI